MMTNKQWQDKLGLSDWTIEIRWRNLADEEACVFKNAQQKYARIDIDFGCPGQLYEYTFVHELLHIVFRDMEKLMKDDRTIRVMELADDALETAINSLAASLTGETWYPWHRDDEIKQHTALSRQAKQE